MAHGGKRDGAGRPRGSQDSKTKAVLVAVEATGITPLAYMIQILQDDKQTHFARLDAAKAAAPYVHPRLNAVEYTGGAEKPVDECTESELDERIAAIRARRTELMREAQPSESSSEPRGLN